MSTAGQFNADQLSFWNGVGGQIWVARQAHTDAILARVFEALLACAAPQPGEAVLDAGCGCGASTLDFARAVGPTGRVVGYDISGPMLDEARRRAAAAGAANVDWRQEDPATAALDGYDLLVSAFGLMFFGDPVAAFTHLREAANPGARLVGACWRPLADNPWMGVPMGAVSPHLPPRAPGNPEAPGMFAFSQPERVTRILTAAGWAEPGFERLDLDLDIAAGKGLDEAVMQSTQIGAVNSWLRNQPAEIVDAATGSLRAALADHEDGRHVRLPGSVWLITSRLA